MNGTAIGLGAILIWLMTTLLVAYISTVPPMQLVSMMFFLGFVSLTILHAVNREDIGSYWRQPWTSYFFWISTAGLYTILIFTSYTLVPIFEANILNHIWPVMLLILAALLNKERVGAIQILGGFVGFAGVVAVFMPETNVSFFNDFHLGHALSLGSATLWALYSAMAKRIQYPVGFLAPVFLVFSLITGALHLAFETSVWPTNLEWLVIAILGVGRISYSMWDYGMKKGDVILLASICYFLPLATSLLLTIFGFGPVRPTIGLGAALIVASCLIVNIDNLKKLWQRVRA